MKLQCNDFKLFTYDIYLSHLPKWDVSTRYELGQKDSDDTKNRLEKQNPVVTIPDFWSDAHTMANKLTFWQISAITFWQVLSKINPQNQRSQK